MSRPTPTDEQEEIRDVEALGLLVLAPAGSGKTEALALRLSGLINRGAVGPPRRALVLTFSNRAKDNIRERLRAHLTRPQLSRRVSVTNIHGFAARVVRAHGSTIGIDQSWRLPTSDWVSEQCDERGLSYAEKDRVKADFQRVKQTAASDEEVSAELKSSSSSEAVAIEALRVRSKQLTYEDLLRLAERVLQIETVARLYREHFAVVIVDEFQDLTLQQLRIVNAIGYQKTTYAGDLAQGIYGWAGAEPTKVLAAIRKEIDAERELTKSHRSSPAVLAAINALAPLTGGTSIACANPADWPHGGLAALLTLADCQAEADNVVKFAKHVLANAPEHRIGVLSRGLARRRFVDRAFEGEALPSHRWDDPMMDPAVASAVKRALDLLKVSGLGGAPAYEQLVTIADVNSVLEPDTRRDLLEGLSWASDLLAQGVSVAEVRSRVKTGDAGTLLSKPGVHLLNAHVGKGQQFDWVVVIGAEDGNIPFFKSAEDPEEARVFSVMLSRARHGVVVMRARTVTTQAGNSRSPDASRFLDAFDDVDEVLDGAAASRWLKSADWASLRGEAAT